MSASDHQCRVTHKASYCRHELFTIKYGRNDKTKTSNNKNKYYPMTMLI